MLFFLFFFLLSVVETRLFCGWLYQKQQQQQARIWKIRERSKRETETKGNAEPRN
jgi:hypothetical protein